MVVGRHMEDPCAETASGNIFINAPRPQSVPVKGTQIVKQAESLVEAVEGKKDEEAYVPCGWV